jgi:hypothetical protein
MTQPADTPQPSPPQAKPSAPATEADPPGIAASVIQKEGEQRTESADVAKARREEELASLDNLPSAAEE